MRRSDSPATRPATSCSSASPEVPALLPFDTGPLPKVGLAILPTSDTAARESRPHRPQGNAALLGVKQAQAFVGTPRREEDSWHGVDDERRQLRRQSKRVRVESPFLATRSVPGLHRS